MNYYIDCLKKYFTFWGRASRKEYWFFAGISFILSIIAGLCDWVLHFPIIAPLYTLAVLGPSLAVLVRRLHDIDRPSPWILLLLIPFVGWAWLIILLASKGTDGENRFGVDPKAFPRTEDEMTY